MSLGLRSVMCLVSACALMTAVPALAQDGARVQEAIDVTDRRIELAETLVARGEHAQAAAELDRGKNMQASAKQAFGSGQFGLAGRLTLEARAHVDRAISIVRGLPDPDRVQLQVERTREILERSRDQIEGCDQPRARALLHVALEMQERAELALRESRYLAALQLSMSARERAFKAMRLCKVQESLQGTAQRALQRTDDTITRAREAVERAGSEQSRSMLARAEALQAQAQGEYRSEHWEAAMRLTQSARTLAQRAARMASNGSEGGRR